MSASKVRTVLRVRPQWATEPADSCVTLSSDSKAVSIVNPKNPGEFLEYGYCMTAHDAADD